MATFTKTQRMMTDAGRKIEIPEAEVPEARADGFHPAVRMFHKSGRQIEVPQHEVEEAKADGFSVGDLPAGARPGVMGGVNAFVENLTNPGDVGDLLSGAAAGVGESFRSGRPWITSSEAVHEEAQQEYERVAGDTQSKRRAELDAIAETHPVPSFAGQIAVEGPAGGSKRLATAVGAPIASTLAKKVAGAAEKTALKGIGVDPVVRESLEGAEGLVKELGSKEGIANLSANFRTWANEVPVGSESKYYIELADALEKAADSLPEGIPVSLGQIAKFMPAGRKVDFIASLAAHLPNKSVKELYNTPLNEIFSGVGKAGLKLGTSRENIAGWLGKLFGIPYTVGAGTASLTRKGTREAAGETVEQITRYGQRKAAPVLESSARGLASDLGTETIGRASIYAPAKTGVEVLQSTEELESRPSEKDLIKSVDSVTTSTPEKALALANRGIVVPGSEKYLGYLRRAAGKGNQNLSAVHYSLAHTDADYVKWMEQVRQVLAGEPLKEGDKLTNIPLEGLR